MVCGLLREIPTARLAGHATEYMNVAASEMPVASAATREAFSAFTGTGNSTNGSEYERQLPRLLYVGDVPVECSYHGSVLLYRILQNYASDRLRIIEGGVHQSSSARRLPDVTYRLALQPGRRLLNTRFHSVLSSALTLTASLRAADVHRLALDFKPDAVLTVAHGYSWLSAARYARAAGIPLHIIVHDDWVRVADMLPSVRAYQEAAFKRAYRTAASRLCVSPFMEEEYQKRYGVSGTVLYPCRSAGAKSHSEPPGQAEPRPLTIAFGGTINTTGQKRALRLLAQQLSSFGGTLRLYGPMHKAEARREGLDLPNIVVCGLVPADEFVERIRCDADVLFAPMSFDSEDEANVRIAFPSKLTEYTAAGLPLLIYGPEYSSAVRWARENAGAAEVVSRESDACIQDALLKLSDPLHRQQLVSAGFAAGERYFSHEAVVGHFFNILRSTT
jgi:glycosyltransferase involved in cell wall biosynthesis